MPEKPMNVYDMLRQRFIEGYKTAQEGEQHITDRVDDDEEVASEGEHGQELTEEVKVEHGTKAVTEDSPAPPEENPGGNVPASGPDEASTTQPVPEESEEHPTQELLRDTMKQAKLSEFQEAAGSLAQALTELSAYISQQAEEESEDDEEEEEEEETSEESKEAKAKKAEETSEESEDYEEESEDEEEESEEAEAAKEAAEKALLSALGMESIEELEKELGKEAAAQAVDDLVTSEQEEAALTALNFLDTVVKTAEADADEYCDLLDAHLWAQPDNVKKEAGLPPVDLMPMAPPMPMPGAAPGEAAGGEDELQALLGALGGGEAAGGEDELQTLLGALGGGEEAGDIKQLILDLLAAAGLTVEDLMAEAEPAPEAKEEAAPAEEAVMEEETGPKMASELDKLLTALKILKESGEEA